MNKKGGNIMAFINMKLNKKEIQDKIYGCWIGKNIGGTIGAPYEGVEKIVEVDGFTTKKGEPLPNDDLDLQLIWLLALETVGAKKLSANILGEYWLSCITPHWGEYGIGKSNLQMGLLPPLSGHFQNKMKDSNGAWIRSELWACLAPGVPNLAVKYAIMDASIDHGMGEGTYAEIFTAALESLAFFESDIRRLIEKALTFIPKECRVARSVNIVLDGYDKKLDWKETRERVLEDSADLGWFMAPGNIAFVVLGLMYGEGDFKESILYSVRCGDDTDCTAGTVGAILGIIKGAKGIPEDWKEYIGDSIKTICLAVGYVKRVAQSCTELTEKVLYTMPEILKAHNIFLEYTDGENNFEEIEKADILSDVSKNYFSRSPYSFELPSLAHSDAFVEYECEPVIKTGDDFKVKITIKNKSEDPFYCDFHVALPETWTADYCRAGYANHWCRRTLDASYTWEMTIHIGERVDAINKIPVMISPRGHVEPIMVPIVLLG